MERIAFLLLLSVLPLMGRAQIYQCPGQDGPIFSDTACPGGRSLDLGPPNVIDSGTTPPQPSAGEPPPPSLYTAFSILTPQNEETIHSNTGEFSVSLGLTPGLQGGNAISVSLDGTQLPTLRYSLQFDVTQAEWESAAAANVQHTLAASVVDRGGATLITASPVQFYVHRTFTRRQEH